MNTRKLKRFHTVSLDSKYEMNIGKINNNIQKENREKNQGKLFLLKVEEAKLHEFTVGYIFILRPYKQKNDKENNRNSKDLINIPENKNSNISDISIVYLIFQLLVLAKIKKNLIVHKQLLGHLI